MGRLNDVAWRETAIEVKGFKMDEKLSFAGSL